MVELTVQNNWQQKKVRIAGGIVTKGSFTRHVLFLFVKHIKAHIFLSVGLSQKQIQCNTLSLDDLMQKQVSSTLLYAVVSTSWVY